MKIVYDCKAEVYEIDLPPKVFICSNNIVDAKQTFINYLERMFDGAVNEQLKD
jgi:hypothetical protein